MNIKTLCLGILHFGEVTGYEINKLASEGRFSHFIEASFGSIYPALTKLTGEGLVTWREEAQAGKPARKVYNITDKGRAVFLEALQEPPKADMFKSEFIFLCLYFDFLPAHYLKAVYAAQTERLTEDLEHLTQARERCDHAGSQFAIGYGMALKRAALDYLKTHEADVVPLEHFPEKCVRFSDKKMLKIKG